MSAKLLFNDAMFTPKNINTKHWSIGVSLRVMNQLHYFRR